MIALLPTQRNGRRSPQEIAQAARRQLRRSPYLSIRLLSCECDDAGFLLVRGCLPSFYLKQLAQEAVADVDGVVQVVNEAEVVRSNAAATVWG